MKRLLCLGLLLAAGVHADDLVSRPLAPHPFPRGRTMFTLLPADQTGLVTTNQYDDPKMKGALYQEFETSSVGTGVAVGDFDGDGRPDLLVVSKTEGCRLFRNLGNFRFEDVTEKAGLGQSAEEGRIWKQGATFVDVNNDGKLDLYICRFRAPNLLYINQGDGTFKESAHAYGLDITDSSVMAAFCDYDRDGRLDVYIATNILDIAAHPNGQRGRLLHQNGDGTFSEVTERAGMTQESQSHSATWWDYDNDGWPDLYVANDYGKPDKLYHNNRDGTFTDVADQVLPHTSFSSMGADLGDVNNDGRIDLFVGDMAATTHVKDQHSLADARGRHEENDNPEAAPKNARNALLLNTGAGRCLEAGFLAGVAATDWTWSPRFEDLDNDGRLDLHITNGFPRDPGVDTVQRSMAAESPSERIRIMYSSPPQRERHLALRNLGDLKFEDVSASWGLDQQGVSFGAAFGDFGGDGNLDLVYANYHGAVTFLRNDNDSGHRIVIDLRGTASNWFGVGATVHLHSAAGPQVRQLVLARGYMSNSEPMLHFGLGPDTDIDTLSIDWPSGRSQTFHHLAVDRRYTITEPANAPARPAMAPVAPAATQFVDVTAASGLAVRSREESVDEVSSQRLLPFRLNRRGPALAVGSLDGTAGNAVVVGGTSQDPLRTFVPAGGGRYTLGTSPATAATPNTSVVDDGPILLFDAQGLGRSDLLITKGGNSLPDGSPEYQARLYYNDGHGNFSLAPDGTLPALTVSAGAVAAADFLHSGRLAVFVGARLTPGAYPTSPRSVLLANRGGKFEDVTDQLAPGLREVGMVTGAVWSDVDGDGWPDLVITVEWGEVKYFHNRQGAGLDDWTEKSGFARAGNGWWTGVAVADFNGDGRPDFVVGNVGLNTQYHASQEAPALLFYGDFGAADEQPQIIEAYFEGGKRYPWRSRRDLGTAFPSLLKRYPSADAFSVATVDDLFGTARLSAAQKFSATEFRSGVFLSQPDGTYRFQPLPRIAQIGPFQGIAAGDFDGDGHADIYAVQNEYGPIVAVGRFDGGMSQLLKGDGHGNFSAVEPAASGLLVPADGKALAVTSLDGSGAPDFIASQNNGPVVAFQNRSGGQWIAVRLRGLPGNPTAVGARIALHTSQGDQVAEIGAGSGYYSQSLPWAWFGLPSGARAAGLTVRWPGGKTAEYPAPAHPGVLELMSPEK